MLVDSGIWDGAGEGRDSEEAVGGVDLIQNLNRKNMAWK